MIPTVDCLVVDPEPCATRCQRPTPESQRRESRRRESQCRACPDRRGPRASAGWLPFVGLGVLLGAAPDCGVVLAPHAFQRFVRAALVAQDGGGEAAASERVAKLAALLPARDGDGFWSIVSRLEGIGQDAAPALTARLDSQNEKTRLGCAKALLALGDARGREKAFATLRELTRGARDGGVRVDAVQIYGRTASDDELDDVIEHLGALLETEADSTVLIALCRTLWELDHVQGARDKLLALLESRDPAVREEAALTLAEGGQYAHGAVKDTLRRLRNEPTPRGRRAELLYRLMKLETQLDAKIYDGRFVPEGTDEEQLLAKREQEIRALESRVAELENRGAPAAGGDPALRNTSEDRLLEEVIRKVETLYVHPEKTSRERLLIEAVKGMVRTLDDHSIFMEAEQAKDFEEGLRGEYAGIGAHISKRPGGPLEVLRPIYGGPSHKAGLLSGDLIVTVDGRPTPELQLDQIKDLLRGPKGTTIILGVVRRGWQEPRDVRVERDRIELSSVYYEALPEGLGYLRLTEFASRSAEEFGEALDTLERGGLRGLIIDLRSNPGGYLPVAEKIADLFVTGDLPIVTQRGRDGSDEETTSPTPDARTSYGIVILVNEHSASASEVVSGCLQDHRRATLVGKRTFGKGSVQRLIPIESRAGATLKLTVQYWYLPLGRCINTRRDDSGRILEPGGVAPDIEVDAETIASWRLEERNELRTNEPIVEYVERHFDALRSLVPLGDGGESSRYPEFDELFRSLDTHAEPDDVRHVVRYHVRRKLEDARGREFAFDLPDDKQLQRAVTHILEVIGRDPKASPAFGWLTRTQIATTTPATNESDS